MNTRAIIAIIAFIALSQSLYSQTTPKAVDGILDLRMHDWEKDGIADLNGNWELYPLHFYTPEAFADSTIKIKPAYSNVPAFWNDYIQAPGFLKGLGYGTYRLKIHCPDNQDSLALKLLTISTAYRLYANRQLVAQAGGIGTTPATSLAEYKPQVVFVNVPDHVLELVIQVSNFSYRGGGVWDFIKLGTLSQIESLQEKNLARDYFIIGGFFMIGIFHLIIFFFFRKTYTPLFLGILCIIICLRVLFTGELAYQIFMSLPWNIDIRLEFISMFLIMTFSVLFVNRLFPDELPKPAFYLFFYGSLAFTATGLFASPLIISYCTRPFEVLIILCSFTGIYVGFKAYTNKKTESRFYLASFIVLFAGLINDILYTSLIVETGHYFYAGLFLFVLLQAVSLSRQFASNFHKLNEANHTLQSNNIELIAKSNIIIEKNEELSKLNKELDSLVYRVTHDLRSPILSLLGLIEHAKTEKDSNELLKYFSMQQKTLTRLDKIIEDIINYSKNSRTKIELEAINFRQIIHHVFEDHQYINHAAAVTKRIEINEQAAFVSDSKRLYVLFNNLISNAIKYSAVTTEGALIKVAVKVTEKGATIKISDNGIGIDEKDQAKIFTMFYRATNIQQGTGLGLYIAKEVVEKLGGTIAVESALKMGTTFTIFIPNHVNEVVIE